MTESRSLRGALRARVIAASSIFRHSSFVIRHFASAAILLPFGLPTQPAFGQAGRIYTQPDPLAPGGIAGKVGVELSHAIAIDQQRNRVFRAELSDGGKAFKFEHVPVGKYDLVLVAGDGRVYEGINLGGDASAITGVSLENLRRRIELADTFFNRHIIHRIGLEGDQAFLLVERLRDKLTLKGSGEKLDANVRRLEVTELHRADDTWQQVEARHLYREGEPITANPPFFKHAYVPALGSIRVVDGMKNLGVIELPFL